MRGGAWAWTEKVARFLRLKEGRRIFAVDQPQVFRPIAKERDLAIG
jgi:hypothetical protein